MNSFCLSFNKFVGIQDLLESSNSLVVQLSFGYSTTLVSNSDFLSTYYSILLSIISQDPSGIFTHSLTKALVLHEQRGEVFKINAHFLLLGLLHALL